MSEKYLGKSLFDHGFCGNMMRIARESVAKEEMLLGNKDIRPVGCFPYWHPNEGDGYDDI